MNIELINSVKDQIALLQKEIKELREQQEDTKQKLLSIAHGINFLQEDIIRIEK